MKALDAIVVGGGPAGTAAAITLACSGANVALLTRIGWTAVGEVVEARVRTPLRELGLWNDLVQSERITATETVSCWGAAEPVSSSGICSPYGEATLIDRNQFDRLLVEGARRHGVATIALSGPARAQPARAGGRVSWHENELRAPLVIDATGRGAGLLGRRRRRLDRLIGVLSYVEYDADAGTRGLLIESTSEGWWYSAPLPRRRAVFAFMTDADLLPRNTIGRTAWLDEQLEAAPLTRARSSAVDLSTVRILRPAESAIRDDPPLSWYSCVGDAFAAYDPLAGQGVATALTKGIALARAIGAEGPQAAINHYHSAECFAWADYVRLRRSIYLREPRWCRGPFWSRRHEFANEFR